MEENTICQAFSLLTGGRGTLIVVAMYWVCSSHLDFRCSLSCGGIGLQMRLETNTSVIGLPRSVWVSDTGLVDNSRPGAWRVYQGCPSFFMSTK
jgi:hypothetical protein